MINLKLMEASQRHPESSIHFHMKGHIRTLPVTVSTHIQNLPCEEDFSGRLCIVQNDLHTNVKLLLQGAQHDTTPQLKIVVLIRHHPKGALGHPPEWRP